MPTKHMIRKRPDLNGWVIYCPHALVMVTKGCHYYAGNDWSSAIRCFSRHSCCAYWARRRDEWSSFGA